MSFALTTLSKLVTESLTIYIDTQQNSYIHTYIQ